MKWIDLNTNLFYSVLPDKPSRRPSTVRPFDTRQPDSGRKRSGKSCELIFRFKKLNLYFYFYISISRNTEPKLIGDSCRLVIFVPSKRYDWNLVFKQHFLMKEGLIKCVPRILILSLFYNINNWFWVGCFIETPGLRTS